MTFFFFRRRRAMVEQAQAWQRAREESQRTPQGEAESRGPLSVAIEGRRFLRDVPYALPKDGQEIERLDFQHYLLKQALKGNALAPIGHFPTSILDVGCGTGRWAREMALHYPHALVTGLDLEEMKTATGPTPPNYHFVPGNVLHRLPFPDASFDYVHQRLLVAAIPAQRWPEVLGELCRVTRHHGWLELIECGVEVVNLGPLTQQFLAWGIEAGVARGLDARVIPQVGTWLKEAGVRRVRERVIELPMGEWGGRVGVLLKEDLLSAFAGLKALYAARGSEDDFQALLQELPAEWEQFHSSYRFYAFYGQK